MRLDPFKLERYLARYEFTAPHQLSCSDCDGLAASDVLALAGDETRQLWDALKLGYTESAGHPLLRAEIAGQYADASDDDVLVAGPQELIFVLMNCLVRNGDHVVCTFPAYQSLYQVAEGLHCEVAFWEADEKAGWRFDPEVLAGLIRPSTRALIMNFPHNPTGCLPSRDDFDAIIEIARRQDLVVLSDEIYRGLEYDESQRLPAACDVYERAVSLGGMSKVYGLAGLRVGWIVSHDSRLLRRVAGFKDYTSICSSAPSEILALIALRARAQIIEPHLQRIRRNRGVLADFIDTYRSLFGWNEPRAGTVCLPRVLPENLSSDDLCQEAVSEAGVVLMPSSVFDYGDRHVRFGLGREAFPSALEAFDAFLETKLRGASTLSPQVAAEPPDEAVADTTAEPEVTPESEAAPEPPALAPEPLLEAEPVPEVAPVPVAEPLPEFAPVPAPEPLLEAEAPPEFESLPERDSEPAVHAAPPPYAPPTVEAVVEAEGPEPADPAVAAALSAEAPAEPVGGGSWNDRFASVGAAPPVEVVELEPASEPALAPWEDFPPSARDAHPEPVAPSAEPPEASAGAGAGGEREAAAGDDEEFLPLEPIRPDGLARGAGLLPDDFFADPEPPAAEPAPAAGFPPVVEPAPPAAGFPPAAEPAPAAGFPPVVEPAPPAAGFPPVVEPAPPAAIPPPPGSSMAIPPPPSVGQGS